MPLKPHCPGEQAGWGGAPMKRRSLEDKKGGKEGFWIKEAFLWKQPYPSSSCRAG